MTNDAEVNLSRYARQIRFEPLGEAGQRRLAAARVLVCGCGALGSVAANTLVRAGVGHVRIVDRDILELNNLQRQVLYDEQDVAAGLPKAVAAAQKLRRINSEVNVEPIVADVTHENIADLAAGCAVIVDGTDNFETRFLINDFSLRDGVPWVYGGCLGAEGQTMTILPGETACLRCLMEDAPPPGTTPTCDTAGILAPAVNVVASLQAAEALKIASGNAAAVSRRLSVIDVWENRLRQVDLSDLRARGDCPTCAHREFPWLAGERSQLSAVLCGRNTVQLRPSGSGKVSLDSLAGQLEGVGEVTCNAYLLRLDVGQHSITVFADGRALVMGTNEPATARTLYAKYIGA